MCRNIRTLHNFDPPVTPEEIEAAALQYIRKVSGTVRPSRANESAFRAAVERVAEATTLLMNELTTHAPPRNREEEARKAKERSAERYGSATQAPSID